MDLRAKGRVFHRQIQHNFSLVVDVSVMQDILHGLNQDIQDTFHFLSTGSRMAEASFSELNEVVNHVPVHGASVRHHHTKGRGPARCGFTRWAGLQSLLERGQQSGLASWGSHGWFFDEVLIMFYQNNIASYTSVAPPDSLGLILSFTKN
jgi:hypothetical protein